MLGNYNIPESKFHYFNVRGYKYDTFKYVNIRKTTLCVIANDVRQSHIKSDIEQKKNRTNEQLNFEIEKSLYLKCFSKLTILLFKSSFKCSNVPNPF